MMFPTCYMPLLVHQVCLSLLLILAVCAFMWATYHIGYSKSTCRTLCICASISQLTEIASIIALLIEQRPGYATAFFYFLSTKYSVTLGISLPLTHWIFISPLLDLNFKTRVRRRCTEISVLQVGRSSLLLALSIMVF